MHRSSSRSTRRTRGRRICSVAAISLGRTGLEGLARIEDAVRVQRGLDGAMHLEGVVTEFEADPPPFQRTHAVLAGECAAEIQCGPEDFVGRRPHLGWYLAAAAAVEDEGGVGVA